MNNNNNDDNFVMNPWNKNNKLITKEDIFNFFEILNIKNSEKFLRINDLNIYQTAFVHKSYTFKENTEIIDCPSDINTKLFSKDYESLEFLGDRCLDLSVAFYLYRKYPDADPGFLTKMKTKIVKKETLAKFADFLGFQDFLIISNHIEEKTLMGRNNIRILEDVMEAFLCALFLDQNKNIENNSYTDNLKNLRQIGPGWNLVNGFIEKLLENCIDFEELVMNEENFKEVLLQYYQREFKLTPKYLEVGVEGPPHERIFTMGVLDKDGSIIAQGKGKSKRDGEQQASYKALIYFGEYEE